MIPLLRASEMQALEKGAIEDWGVPSLVLQEHAALGALGLLPADGPIHVLAGPGNNGGDALALARLARLRGQTVEVWTQEAPPAWRGDAALQARLWEGLGGTYRQLNRDSIPSFRGWVVDGLFGLGTRLPLREPTLSFVAEMHAWGQACRSSRAFRVLALDLPTGLDPSSSDVYGPVIPADRTACFGHRKVCHGLRPARSFCGEITVVPIPLPVAPQATLFMMDRPGPTLSGRWDTHKRDFGHVAIRAGSLGMSGAAVLAALGALRVGAGLVTVLTDAEVRAEIAAQVPEAMVLPWEGRLPDGIDVLLTGPGGVSEIPAWHGPLVLDASALKEGEGAFWMARPETVITPHPGEFARLFGKVKPPSHQTSDRLAQALEVATGPGILALKGAQSVVAGGGTPEVWINPTGHRGLSTGGTGDFLAGMVAAKVALWKKEGQGLGRLKEGVAEALWLHGAAAERLGPGPLLVRELGPSLSSLLRELNQEVGHV
ncbi:MAG: carbohydrate kinase, YjeF related protein [Holophagaceae bacterium]|nr:carbohydrate kinase, YjeF related protein [Holophagaceae bacterium]